MTNVLSIAGLDPSGGAGLLADIKTFNHFGVNGFGVTSALTFQCEDKFHGVNWLTPEEIIDQLIPLYERYDISVVKIGLIENLATLNTLLAFILHRNAETFIIWDPVISSSSGFVFHEDPSNEDLQKALSTVSCLTPNLIEYKQLLTWLKNDVSLELMINALILKGGHGEGDEVEDRLYWQGELTDSIVRSRLKKNVHGSGCIFSSAFAACYAKTNSLVTSFHEANQYVYDLIQVSESKLAPHHLIPQS